MKFAVILFLVSLNAFAYSQKLVRINVAAGPDQVHALLIQLYQYPEFQNGLIVLKNGTSISGRLNYHKALGQIHVINKADTVAILENYDIRYVLINTDSIFFDSRFITVIHTGKYFSLGKHEKVRSAHREAKMAYRKIPDPVSVTESLRSAPQKSFSLHPNGKTDIPLIKQTIFYLGDRHHQFKKVTRKNILMMFPGKDYLIKDFIEQNKTDLENLEDLKRLFTYMDTLR